MARSLTYICLSALILSPLTAAASTTSSRTSSTAASTTKSSSTTSSSTSSAAVSTTKSFSTTTPSTASSSASASATASALACPAANQTTFVYDKTGYLIECGFDRYDNDVSLVYTATLNDCIKQCDAVSNCVDVSYLPGGAANPCYLKNGIGYVNYRSNIWGARAVNTTRTEALSCPFNNGTSYKTNNGARTYTIECDTDHYDSDFSTNPTYVAKLEDCISACDSKTGCQSAVLSGTACYLKYGTNPGLTKLGLAAAKCFSGCQSTLKSSTVAATTSSISTAKTTTATTMATVTSTTTTSVKATTTASEK